MMKSNIEQAYKYSKRKFRELSKKFDFANVKVSMDKYTDTLIITISAGKHSKEEAEMFKKEFSKVRDDILEKFPLVYLEYKLDT